MLVGIDTLLSDGGVCTEAPYGVCSEMKAQRKPSVESARRQSLGVESAHPTLRLGGHRFSRKCERLMRVMRVISAGVLQWLGFGRCVAA